MEKMRILGFDVIVEEGTVAGAIATAPALPGCICQVDRKEDVPKAMASLIRTHLLELASRKPKANAAKPEVKERNRAARKP